jgi:hypothetical protein
MEVGGTMRNILLCLATNFLWLFEKYGFRIIDSLWEPGFGGQGMVALSNGVLQIRLLTDRDKLSMEFSLLQHGWPKDEYVTVDLLYTRIEGGSMDSALVNEQTTRFLRARFDDILALFSDGKANELAAEFKRLKKERAKRLFG